MQSIAVEDLAVRYKLYRERRAHLRTALFSTIRGRGGYEYLWALDGVSFALEEGTILGVIGRNGAGKSTLCLVLSGIIHPDRGTARINGSVSTLLGLGAGFVKDLSGRDNVYLNAAFLGLGKKQIDARFDQIVEFAELEDFIDSPIRQYSSGMVARLGFSVAASIEPEILIIDEVLGVGDEGFKEKCQQRMRQMIQRAKAIVIVAHSSEMVSQLCTKTLWLELGKVKMFGDTPQVIAGYKAFQKEWQSKRVKLGPGVLRP
jgi:ABC-type polysaccharide/polyol phosphate transport system ATPase subunit